MEPIERFFLAAPLTEDSYASHTACAAPTAIHKTTAPPPQNGHAALGSRQQHRSNIKDRAAPPLFLRREPSGKLLYVLVKTLPWSARRSRPGHFS
jgi:hypothetical protein